MNTYVSRRRRLLVMMAATGVAVAVAVNAFATGATAPATATICIKPNGQLRAVTPENPACVAPEAASEWTVNGVKAITAGTGLVGRDDGGIVQLEVDPGLIENASSGKIIAGFDDGPHVIANAFPPARIAELPLPSGSYAIFAKLSFDNNFIVTPLARVNCRLEAGADFDEVETVVERRADEEGTTDLAQGLQVVHRFSEPGSAILSCGARAETLPKVAYEDLKIVAIRGSSLSNTFLGD